MNEEGVNGQSGVTTGPRQMKEEIIGQAAGVLCMRQNKLYIKPIQRDDGWNRNELKKKLCT